MTGHSDCVEAVGLQVGDEVRGRWDVDVLVVDDLIRAPRKRLVGKLGLRHKNNNKSEGVLAVPAHCISHRKPNVLLNVIGKHQKLFSGG